MDDTPHQVETAGRPARRVTISLKSVGLVAAVIVLCGLSFVGGRQYQKHHGSSANSSATAAGGGLAGGRFGGGVRREGGIGSVTAISSSSITVSDQRSGTSKTYSITSSTQITDNGSTVDYTDIKTGDTVLVTASSSSSTTAARILVNPSFGGGMAAPGGSSGQSNTESQ
ncbi:MAG TPA: hypothetical protein VHC21_03240 [Candidatus Saccharimonadales bacterium]|nr:hypothetical protein [Candidatus Saccharimonadales bacterium]